MLKFIAPRLRRPALIAVLGTAYAASWAVHGGHGRVWAVTAEIATIAWAVTMYVWGGRDNEQGALAGSRPDERQRLVAQRSWALTGKTAMLAASAGLAVSTAVRSADWLPFAVMLAVTGFAYLMGLSTFGVGEEDPAYDESDGLSGPAPVSHWR
jgi:hypothetical protein